MLCKCLNSKDCVMYMHCTKSLQIYGLHTNANQNLALMCEVSLLNRTKRAEQRHLWEGQWQERNYAVASLGHHLLMCSSMPECRQHCRRKLIRDSARLFLRRIRTKTLMRFCGRNVLYFKLCPPMHQQTEFHYSSLNCALKSLHSIPLTVLKVVEERHIYSTKSISLWRSSGRHGEASIKRWQVCKVNLRSVRRSERWWEDQQLWQHIWDFKIWTSHNRCNRV